MTPTVYFYIFSILVIFYENTKTIFPIGHLTKLQVRQIANEANLIIANKAESMGLCFVGEKNKFADFLGEYIDNTPGEIRTIDGHVIGMVWYGMVVVVGLVKCWL